MEKKELEKKEKKELENMEKKAGAEGEGARAKGEEGA